MSQIKIKRGTRAQLDAAASGAGLIQGEPYLITDEDRLAVGLTTTTYEEFVKPTDPISDLAETASAKILTSSERNKLDGIETNATADQSAAEIKTSYESNADTNEFSDAEQTLLGNQSGSNSGDEPAASATTPGIVELATIAEVDTGTDTTRAITPDALEGSALQTKVDGIEAGATSDLFSATNSNASAITIGQPVYVDGSATVDLARANAAATDRAIGLVADASISAAASGAIRHGGVVSSANWTPVIGSTNLTAGADYFLSATTAGQLTATAPTTAGQFVSYVGHAISTTKLLIEIERPIGL